VPHPGTAPALIAAYEQEGATVSYAQRPAGKTIEKSLFQIVLIADAICGFNFAQS
jgi:hypothetical protein